MTLAQTDALGDRDYDRLGLVQLAECIATASDREALREFHDCRTPFRFRDGPPIGLVAFVDALCLTPRSLHCVNGDDILLEFARDLTLDKFSKLPRGGCNPDGQKRRAKGVDCRYYFREFLRRIRTGRSRKPVVNRVDEEHRAAHLLQRYVLRHFHLACLEARRRCNPARFRYLWHADGRVIPVWMPRRMSGRDCGAWLRAQVADDDLHRNDAAVRVQTIVDARLGVPRHVFWAECHEEDIRRSSTGEPPDLMAIEEQITVTGLANVVAEEKAEKIHAQRPAIQALGRVRLKSLIHRIFDDLSDGRYEEKAIAEAFGMNRSTFSRFAGSRWRSCPDSPPPDLWTNVAHTLSNHAAFVELAEAAGVLDPVLKVANRSFAEGTRHA